MEPGNTAHPAPDQRHPYGARRRGRRRAVLTVLATALAAACVYPAVISAARAQTTDLNVLYKTSTGPTWLNEYMNGGDAPFPEFHAVYIDRESFAHFKKTGEFRDGTVLVKDLVSVGSKEAPSGKGYFEGDFNGMDVSIKDSKRFKDEPGNWGYFTFGHKPPLKAEAVMNNAASCNSCHQGSAAKDWVFLQYYPALRAAAPKAK